jgi:hypothetical protein
MCFQELIPLGEVACISFLWEEELNPPCPDSLWLPWRQGPVVKAPREFLCLENAGQLLGLCHRLLRKPALWLWSPAETLILDL